MQCCAEVLIDKWATMCMCQWVLLLFADKHAFVGRLKKFMLMIGKQGSIYLNGVSERRGYQLEKVHAVVARSTFRSQGGSSGLFDRGRLTSLFSGGLSLLFPLGNSEHSLSVIC